MNREDIIRMARETRGPITDQWFDMDVPSLQRFYDAAFKDGAEAEREDVARLAERYDDLDTSGYDTAHSIAAAIRARGGEVMNRDVIIRIAREAGFEYFSEKSPELQGFELFANLIKQEVIQRIKDKKNPAYSDIVSDGGMDQRN